MRARLRTDQLGKNIHDEGHRHASRTDSLEHKGDLRTGGRAIVGGESKVVYMQVTISYFEIYNENIIDLLAKDEPARYL